MPDITPNDYLRYAEKKRKKLLIVFSLVSVLPLWMIGSFYFEHGFMISDIKLFNAVVWMMTIIALSAILHYFMQIKTDSWYKFLGLKEIENLIALEYKPTVGYTIYNGKHEHRDSLKNGWYKGYDWF